MILLTVMQNALGLINGKLFFEIKYSVLYYKADKLGNAKDGTVKALHILKT